MAKLTVTQSQAVNDLVNYVLGRRNVIGEPVSEECARDAAALLADHASSSLMAGVDGQTVRELWSKRAARVRRRK